MFFVKDAISNIAPKAPLTLFMLTWVCPVWHCGDTLLVTLWWHYGVYHRAAVKQTEWRSPSCWPACFLRQTQIWHLRTKLCGLVSSAGRWPSLSVRLFVCLSLSVCLSVSLSVCDPLHLPVCCSSDIMLPVQCPYIFNPYTEVGWRMWMSGIPDRIQKSRF